MGTIQSFPLPGAARASDLAFLHDSVPLLNEPLLSSAVPASGADPRVTPQQAGASLALPRTFLGPSLPFSLLPLHIHSLCLSTLQRHRSVSLFLWGVGFISGENIIIWETADTVLLTVLGMEAGPSHSIGKGSATELHSQSKPARLPRVMATLLEPVSVLVTPSSLRRCRAVDSVHTLCSQLLV